MPSALIGALRVNLSADTAEFMRQMTTAEKIAERFGYAMGSSIRRQLLAFAGAAAAAAGPAALGLLVKSSMEAISAQVDMARRVGASVGAIQTLQEAAKLAGASQEALTAALGRLNTQLGVAARQGAGPAYEALQRLGLSARELSQMDADERVKALSDRMAELGFTSQQYGDTLKQLGIKQQEIINLFMEGSAAIDQTRQDLSDWGVLLSDIDASKVEQAGDALDKMATMLQGIGNQIAVAVAPRIIELSEYFAKLAKGGDLVRYVVNEVTQIFKAFNEELIRDGALIDAIARRWQQAQEVIASFRIGKEGGVDWAAFHDAHARAAADIAKIWTNMDAQLQQLHGPSTLLAGVESYLNANSPLMRGLDSFLAKMKEARGGGEGETEADAKERERQAADLLQWQEHLGAKLASLQESLLSEREAINAEYAQRLADLATFEQNKLITAEEYAAMRQQIEEDFTAKVKALNEEMARDAANAEKLKQAAIGDTVDNLQAALDTMFGDSKIAAIANAIINTAQAVTRTLAEYGATPWGWAAAAAAAAAGLAQIATIRGTSKSGGGGGGIHRAAQTTATPQPAASQQAAGAGGGGGATLFINGVNPNQIFTGEQLRELIGQIQEFQRDGGKVVLAPI